MCFNKWSSKVRKTSVHLGYYLLVANFGQFHKNKCEIADNVVQTICRPILHTLITDKEGHCQDVCELPPIPSTRNLRRIWSHNPSKCTAKIIQKQFSTFFNQ